MPEQLGVTYPTAKADCKRLVEVGILELLPNVSPTTYYSSDIFNIAYKGIGDESMCSVRCIRDAARPSPQCPPHARGNSTVNCVPCPNSLWTVMVPPWASTILRAVGSPSPEPSRLVE